MIESLPEEIQAVIQQILDAETKISIGDPATYNAFLADSSTVTAISASGRFMLGEKEVSQATDTVSVGNIGERDRIIQWIASDYSDTMAYVVFKTSVTILKEDGAENPLCWIITLIMKRFEEGWRLVHRQNTRSQI